ncbi:hypothetical protein Droror1_Dr00023409 [Drosera rotundifolia]
MQTHTPHVTPSPSSHCSRAPPSTPSLLRHSSPIFGSIVAFRPLKAPTFSPIPSCAVFSSRCRQSSSPKDENDFMPNVKLELLRSWQNSLYFTNFVLRNNLGSSRHFDSLQFPIIGGRHCLWKLHGAPLVWLTGEARAAASLFQCYRSAVGEEQGHRLLSWLLAASLTRKGEEQSPTKVGSSAAPTPMRIFLAASLLPSASPAAPHRRRS